MRTLTDLTHSFIVRWDDGDEREKIKSRSQLRHRDNVTTDAVSLRPNSQGFGTSWQLLDADCGAALEIERTGTTPPPTTPVKE